MRLQALFFVLISFVVTSAARSQSNELLIQGQTGKLYLEHTVVAKETWYSMGRLYNISPRQIAAFNHLVMAKPLVIGATIQIPLTTVNFSQNGVKTAAETLVPLYHIIQEKEWLYRISINHNKVPVPSLEKWNKINKDQAKAGMHLIVGFLKVKTALSALATSTPAPVAAAVMPGGSTAAGNSPLRGNPSTGSNPPTTTNPATTTGGHPSNAAISSMLGDSPSSTSRTSSAQPPMSAVTGSSLASTPAIHFNGGFFKVDFIETGKSVSGTAGIFKSTSGWQDGKYYALMNNVPVGTIVKVSVAGGEKSVYAKVLGQLPDMKESVGLTIRISNAAASELGAGERLNVDLRY
jgi:LysM repeat protein